MRLAWIAAGTLEGRDESFSKLAPPVAMRIANVARWIGSNSSHQAEMYRPNRRYDVVIFFKAMDSRCQDEAHRIQGRGGKVVFDANVNYYDIWGAYEIPATRPTAQQQADAICMTTMADAVVADSAVLLELVSRYNETTSFIPDNVDLRFFGGRRRHRRRRVTRLVWSGMASKAVPLLDLCDVFAGLRAVELVIASERAPAELEELRKVIRTRFMRFGMARYALALRFCDVIISPKRLVNGYEVGHTEWKITLGMAGGLPAVASPQRSYVEALSDGGGVVASSMNDWATAISQLVENPEHRAVLGARAAETVRERYSTDVVACNYLQLLEGLVE